MEKNKLGLGILIGVLTTLVIIMGVFIIYDKVLSNDNEQVENNDDIVDENNSTNDTDKESNQNSDGVKLNYEIVTVNNEPVQKKLIVNGKDTGIVGIDIYDINYSEDALLLTVNDIDSITIYLVNKDAKVINSYVGKNYTNAINKNTTSVAGAIIRNSYMIDTENGGIYITSDDLGQDPQYVVCSKQDNDIVEYTEWFKYFGNNEFSTDTNIIKTTAKEYIQKNNIKCN